MKRILLSLLAVSLAFVFACQTQNVNVNKNATANANANLSQGIGPTMSSMEKTVQIVIFDAPGGQYEVQDPGSVHISKNKNQKIIWCISYDGTTPPTKVVIDNFRSPPPPATPTATNPFGDGSAGDNTFDIPSADFNHCKPSTKTPKANVVLGTYKYKITVKVNGVDSGSLDPEVIIDN